MDCLDDELILAVAEGRKRLDPAGSAHLAACDECRLTLAAAARGAGAEPSARAPRPGTLPLPEGEPAWDELGPGVVLGGGAYVLERFLGAGGMGVVWSARRTSDGLAVALKIAQGGDPDLARRFEREARVASALAHPNVVRIHDVLPSPAGAAGRGPCIVQELVEGETFEAKLARERRLELRDAARLMLPVASALEAAHARGIVHRDVKPSNILIAAANRRVVVVDFGIAKLLGGTWGAHSKLTRTGAVVGTPRYMAPEQVFGEADVDARADVWALGAVLYRALAGRDAIEVDGVGAMVRTLREREAQNVAAKPPPALPQNVAWLLESALTIRRETRLDSVRPFLAVLSVVAR